MKIDICDIAPEQAYHLMIQTLTPRPVAWVLSINDNMSYNLAPFSYFNGVCSDPPIVMMSMGYKRDGNKKDTWKNIESDRPHVIHLASDSQGELIDKTGDELEYGESELNKNSIEVKKQDGWPLPRLKNCKIAYLCQLHKIIKIGNKDQGMVLSEIKSFYIEDELISLIGSRYNINQKKINPIARLGQGLYGVVGVI